MEGYKTLKASQKVQFSTENGPKDVHAIDIQAIEESTPQPATDPTTSVVQPQSPTRSTSEEAVV